jgi:hypothetical protein
MIDIAAGLKKESRFHDRPKKAVKIECLAAYQAIDRYLSVYHYRFLPSEKSAYSFLLGDSIILQFHVSTSLKQDVYAKCAPKRSITIL